MATQTYDKGVELWNMTSVLGVGASKNPTFEERSNVILGMGKIIGVIRVQTYLHQLCEGSMWSPK
jgi:hypothetical protein